MREIKFRAFVDNGLDEPYIAIQGMPDLETLQSFMFHYGDRPLTLYTGEKDKNKIEIFEGDILKSEHFNTNRKQYYLYHIVMWDDNYLCWKVVSVNNSEGNDITVNGNPQLWVYIRNTNYSHEVIGNKFLNPELLK